MRGRSAPARSVQARSVDQLPGFRRAGLAGLRTRTPEEEPGGSPGASCRWSTANLRINVGDGIHRPLNSQIRPARTSPGRHSRDDVACRQGVTSEPRAPPGPSVMWHPTLPRFRVRRRASVGRGPKPSQSSKRVQDLTWPVPDRGEATGSNPVSPTDSERPPASGWGSSSFQGSADYGSASVSSSGAAGRWRQLGEEPCASALMRCFIVGGRERSYASVQ